MYSYGPPHMAEQKQDDQLEHTYSCYVRIRDVALKTCQRRWTIGRSGKRGSGISVLATRHDDDDLSNGEASLLEICRISLSLWPGPLWIRIVVPLRLVTWLFGFYGRSTFVGYLMPNPFLYKWSILFQAIQFSIQKQFHFKKFSLALVRSLVLFDQ